MASEVEVGASAVAVEVEEDAVLVVDEGVAGDFRTMALPLK